MKRMAALLMLLALVLCAVPVGAEIGFAEVKKGNVNLRETPNGERICYLDAGYDVYVFEEKHVDGSLWCHVYTDVRKRTRDAWIRGDMLRFLSDEFTDVVSVHAGNHYVTGLRADGTVAIMGNDMPHQPCIDEVRSWSAIAQVVSSTCTVCALDRGGNIFSIGNNDWYGAEQAARLSGDEPILLDADGYIMPQTWVDGTETNIREFFLVNDEIGGLVAHSWTDAEATPDHPALHVADVQFQEVFTNARQLYGGLTRDGEVLCLGEYAPYQKEFEHGPYVDIDNEWQIIIAVRADGRVDAATALNASVGTAPYDACRTENWECVIKAAAGTNHTLGLRDDGRVYYAGPDSAHRMQVESWTDVVDISAGRGYSIALKKDGSVVMAGAYRSYDR
ncbi:MAG: hypothetical protein IJ418_18665 [Clostridia bacterium]|nr:hypothetical protein [Clostridia bacterium]